ncbi:MAG: hypothetical protein LBJ00_06465 [Planctomycetaceae bacterium]|nr:hypothetical protein [Planctomycetaceae bacterium]
MLRLPNALRCRFTVASGILKQLEYKPNKHADDADLGRDFRKIRFFYFLILRLSFLNLRYLRADSFNRICPRKKISNLTFILPSVQLRPLTCWSCCSILLHTVPNLVWAKPFVHVGFGITLETKLKNLKCLLKYQYRK